MKDNKAIRLLTYFLPFIYENMHLCTCVVTLHAALEIGSTVLVGYICFTMK